MFFTTSWDDGYALDLRLADLLTKYGCTGTFYVCPKAQHGKEMLTEAQIKDLSARHEIGAHSLTHPKLTEIPADKAREEISGSKAWVERVTGKECSLFCYPYGDENADIRAMVRDAGFKGGRTTERLQFKINDPYAMPVTLQIAPFPWRRSFKPAWKILDPLGALRVSYPILRFHGVPLKALTSWLSMAKALFDIALAEKQPFFHLYGHSHEIQKYWMWGDLENFLQYVSTKQVEHVANSRLLND